MDLTKMKNRPLLVAAFAGVALLVLLGTGLSHQGKTLPQNQPEAAVEQPLTEPVQPAGVAQIKTHTIGEGETLSSIAENYHIDVDTLRGANPALGEIVYPGDKLIVLPSKGVLHAVADGDTLWRISSVYGVEITSILEANAKQGEGLTIGEKLFVPGAKPVVDLPPVPVSRSSVSRFSWPAAGEISSPFGMRWGRLHAGIDIANDVGTAVTAALAGKVAYTGWYGGYGYTLILEHSSGYSTLYGHLSGFAVNSGQYVRAGQQIAFMGNTGYSTGPHLHFEVRHNDTPINPLKFLP